MYGHLKSPIDFCSCDLDNFQIPRYMYLNDIPTHIRCPKNTFFVGPFYRSKFEKLKNL